MKLRDAALFHESDPSNYPYYSVVKFKNLPKPVVKKFFLKKFLKSSDNSCAVRSLEHFFTF